MKNVQDWMVRRNLWAPESETPAFETLRTLLIEGKVTKCHLMKLKGLGPGAWAEMLNLLGLEEAVRIKRPSVAIPMYSPEEEKWFQEQVPDISGFLEESRVN